MQWIPSGFFRRPDEEGTETGTEERVPQKDGKGFFRRPDEEGTETEIDPVRSDRGA